ncbi:MAG TPA: DUF1761 domain-containing protein [Candidatus Limnocylindria bacterium]
MFDHVNWVAVLGASIVAFAFNAIWHGPLFGRRWGEYVGVEAPAGPPLPPILVANFVLTLVGATALAAIVTAFSADAAVAAFVGILVWTASGLVVKLNEVLFARQPVGLFYIDGIGHLITLVIVAVIVGVFRT